MWVRFTQPFDFSPPAFGGRVTQAFQAGSTLNVTTECGKAAIAAGKAVKVATLKKGSGDAEGDGRG